MTGLSRAGAATTLTLVSGGTMMLAGYVGHSDSWGKALPLTLVAAVLILAAFRAARDGASVEMGFVPPALRRPLATVAALTSGWIMVLAGYGLAAWGWWAAALLLPIAGVVVCVALLLGASSNGREAP